jgi:DNA (cytosine-5)-methyltransferase 1
MKLSVGSLFSGIGGFELGLERTGGFKTIWQCEKDEFCLKVLAKHWPDVMRFTDIHDMKENIPYVDVICGGFPCQPVPCAGKRKGAQDERWLWPEFNMVVREVRPEWVLIENVPGLLSANAGRLFAGILRDLSSSGYDAEWNIVSAASVGAPHLRKRVFVIARQMADTRCERLERPKLFERDLNVCKCTSNKGGWAVEPSVGRVANGIPSRVDRLRALGNAIVPQCAEFVGGCLLEFINGVHA